MYNITNDADVAIRCSDTAILVYVLRNISHLVSSSLTVWSFISAGNNQKYYIGVTSLYHEIRILLSKAKQWFHTIIGCDYNTAFFKKGKIRHFIIFTKRPEYQDAFSKLHKSDYLPNER